MQSSLRQKLDEHDLLAACILRAALFPGSQLRTFSEVSKVTLKSDFVLFGN